jgi:hypothetical protein
VVIGARQHSRLGLYGQPRNQFGAVSRTRLGFKPLGVGEAFFYAAHKVERFVTTCVKHITVYQSGMFVDNRTDGHYVV